MVYKRMTIMTLDVETIGLDATAYITGNAYCQGKHFTTRNKKELWEYAKLIGRREKAKRRLLTIYCHNAEYDFYSVAAIGDPGLKIICHRPFIASYYEEMEMTKQFNNEKEKKAFIKNKEKESKSFKITSEGKEAIEYTERVETIKFLDSMSIFKMSLDNAGKIIGYEKHETPYYLKADELRDKGWSEEKIRKTIKEHISEIEHYCRRDCEVTMKLIEHVKDKLKEENIVLKRLVTINQIAISYLLNKLRKDEKIEGFWFDERKVRIERVTNRKIIHQSYKGARVEAWRTGAIEEVTSIDVNSLYPLAAITMKFPNLKTEEKIYNPLAMMTEKELLSYPGVSKAIVINHKDEIGLLPIREIMNFYPTIGKAMIGTWNHEELRKAKELGYEIIDITESVIYEETYNPMKKVMKEMYQLKEKAKDDFEYFFYKRMMNGGIGKLGQKNKEMDYIIDDYEEVDNYIEKGYEQMQDIGLDCMMGKEITKGFKKFYCPIIPSSVNAKARAIMHDHYKKIGLKDLVYTDTDSIVFTGEHENKFKIGRQLGEFKIEQRKVPAMIYGRKTKLIGDKVTATGVRGHINALDFRNGVIFNKKMITLKSSKNTAELGKFKKESRDLAEVLKTHDEKTAILRERNIYIDADIKKDKENRGQLRSLLKEITEKWNSKGQ